MPRAIWDGMTSRDETCQRTFLEFFLGVNNLFLLFFLFLLLLFLLGFGLDFFGRLVLGVAGGLLGLGRKVRS
jgi:hypothetical protein